ncbi:hypothetical protein [Clostridium sp. MD294]|uniref:hypothetical protein n=1 Tax=Clostridium sp. MD294 TaxID=97138 RepID=UPI0002C90449|nr:hypothetical protein [Clostridium sp. MD294]USF28972.1 hypothetical protein C820_000355 [Clostridium sp. MD294]
MYREDTITNTTNFDVELERYNKETIKAMLEAEHIAYNINVKRYSDIEQSLMKLKK